MTRRLASARGAREKVAEGCRGVSVRYRDGASGGALADGVLVPRRPSGSRACARLPIGRRVRLGLAAGCGDCVRSTGGAVPAMGRPTSFPSVAVSGSGFGRASLEDGR